MRDFQDKKILLGICGGIAAYKSAFLVRELVRLGAEVRVVMTDSAKEFISPLTFQALSANAVRDTLFDSEAERAMGHIELARWADFCIIAPASANCLAKLAQGLADDLLSTLYLVLEVPVFICPAMNKSMWAHPATQTNAALLESRGNILIGPAHGEQACGEFGAGRLMEMEDIICALRFGNLPKCLQDKRVLITAGPTEEKIDPVRYISNRSSGKMGYALAKAAQTAGAKVVLISGPTKESIPSNIEFIAVKTAQEMDDKVQALLQKNDIFIAAAAVADYRVINISAEKIKKHSEETLTLNLVKNPDILKNVVATNKAVFVVGFAAETQDLIKNASSKLEAKKLNMVIANYVGEGIGFESEENKVTIITKNTQEEIPSMHKTRLAAKIIAIIAENLQNIEPKSY